MEIQRIINLLNDSVNQLSKFATKKWYVINSESKGTFNIENLIKFVIDSIKSNFCVCSEPYIFVAGDMTFACGNKNTKEALKRCALFKTCQTEISNAFVDEADFFYIVMHKYNLIEFSDNYSDISGSLWQFTRGEINNNFDVITAKLILHHSNTNQIGDAILN